MLRLNRSFVVGALIGVFGAAIGIRSLIAETAAPPVYLVIESESAKDEASIRYAELLGATLAPFKGRMLSQDATAISVDESAPLPGTISLVTFETTADLKAWWDSPFHQALVHAREKVAKSRTFALEGHPPS